MWRVHTVNGEGDGSDLANRHEQTLLKWYEALKVEVLKMCGRCIGELLMWGNATQWVVLPHGESTCSVMGERRGGHGRWPLKALTSLPASTTGAAPRHNGRAKPYPGPRLRHDHDVRSAQVVHRRSHAYVKGYWYVCIVRARAILDWK